LRGAARTSGLKQNVVIVGQGTLAQGQDFDRTHGKGLRALVDTARESYRVLAMVRSLDLRRTALSTLKGIQAAARGHIQGTIQGDAKQHGGTLVVTRGGYPLYFHRSDFAGDHPPVADVLKALKAAAKATA
jgi:hypothetical protein